MVNKLFSNLTSLVFDRETGNTMISNKPLAPQCGAYQHIVATGNNIWHIKHNYHNDNVSVNILVKRGDTLVNVEPDNIRVVNPDNIIITFLDNEVGVANMFFVCGDSISNS